MKRTPSTPNGWISQFSWDWHCTSFKKNAVKYIQWLLKYLFRHVNKKIIFYFWPFQWKPFRINVMETTLMHLIARNYVFYPSLQFYTLFSSFLGSRSFCQDFLIDLSNNQMILKLCSFMPIEQKKNSTPRFKPGLSGV